MKLFSFSLFLVVVTLLGCSFRKQTKPASNFFRDFNLQEVVKQTNTTQLKPETGGYGSGFSSEARDRNFDLSYRIEEQNGKKFNESKFINKLKVAVAGKIAENGADSMRSGSSDNESFYFSYSDNDNTGLIEITGSRLEGNEYKLWCAIRENTKVRN